MRVVAFRIARLSVYLLALFRILSIPGACVALNSVCTYRWTQRKIDHGENGCLGNNGLGAVILLILICNCLLLYFGSFCSHVLDGHVRCENLACMRRSVFSRSHTMRAINLFICDTKGERLFCSQWCGSLCVCNVHRTSFTNHTTEDNFSLLEEMEDVCFW